MVARHWCRCRLSAGTGAARRETEATPLRQARAPTAAHHPLRGRGTGSRITEIIDNLKPQDFPVPDLDIPAPDVGSATVTQQVREGDKPSTSDGLDGSTGPPVHRNRWKPPGHGVRHLPGPSSPFWPCAQGCKRPFLTARTGFPMNATQILTINLIAGGREIQRLSES